MNKYFKKNAIFFLNVYGGNTGIIPKKDIRIPKSITKLVGDNISVFLNKKIEEYA